MLDGKGTNCGDLLLSTPCDFCSSTDSFTQALQSLTKKPVKTPSFRTDNQLEKNPPRTTTISPTRFPASDAPSAAIIRDASIYTKARSSINSKARILDLAVIEIGSDCPVCWILHGISKPRHPHLHDFFRVCFEITYIDQASLWIEAKRSIKSVKQHGKHCWSCGLPLGERRPQNHGELSGKDHCVMQDWVILFVWAVMLRPKLWEEAKKEFPDLPELDDGHEAIGLWCIHLRGVDYVYNGLRLAIWVCSRVFDGKIN
ncbi:hypothetical protein M422DRAFT_248287 [Sphaerobolus stellatus SS14]|uniref:Uncharacterized protein n=1 Tax=Sphaerobolus stellatus (strain SS14) TaxID=990650 RepID=A0A0C9W656_SPHS4|nr:hypothetical protein M422DRAFT_248287 [Sphaerobolus stellatus SS14]